MKNPPRGRLKNILHQNPTVQFTISELSKVAVGQKYTDADGKDKVLSDSRFVSKRKRDLREATSQILETAQNSTSDRASSYKSQDKSAGIDVDSINFISNIISKEFANFVCTVTGSPRYDRIINNFATEVISNTLLNSIDLPVRVASKDSLPEEEPVQVQEENEDASELETKPKAKVKKSPQGRIN